MIERKIRTSKNYQYEFELEDLVIPHKEWPEVSKLPLGLYRVEEVIKDYYVDHAKAAGYDVDYVVRLYDNNKEYTVSDGELLPASPTDLIRFKKKKKKKTR